MVNMRALTLIYSKLQKKMAISERRHTALIAVSRSRPQYLQIEQLLIL